MVRTLASLASEDPARNRRSVGGKAAELANLVGMGLPVPDAIVLPVQTLRTHLRQSGLWQRARSGEDLSQAIRQTSLAAPLRQRIDQAVKRLLKRARRGASGTDRVLAVRSSATDEDGRSASFAGQYRTVIGVGAGDQVEAAVLECWASAWSPEVAAYRQAGGGSLGPAPMAVLIQVMIEPRCAGVLFTVNPATGSWREMAVEAAWGQCEAVVSGVVVPEFHRVQRPRRTPRPIQRVLARVRLAPLERVAGQQAQRLVLRRDEAGTRPVWEAVPASLQDQFILSEAQVLSLCRLGLRIEAKLGCPVDVEWALDEAGRTWVLQARPVTAGADVHRAGPTVWTRRFVGERWTVPATPLGWSLMRELLEWFIAYPETSRRYLGGDPPTRLVRFAPYFNVTLFRHLAFKLPGFPPPRFMVELLPPQEERGWLRRRAQAPDLRVYAAVLHETLAERRWERFRWNLFTNDKAWQRLLPQLESRLDQLAVPLRRRVDAQAHTEICLGLAREYVKVHICSLLFANIWYQLAQAALDRAGQAHLAADVLSPPQDTQTAQVNRELWRLGQGQLSLDDFLARYGHRADGSWEIFTPRWREDPQRVLDLAASLRGHPDPAIAAGQAAARAAAGLALLDGVTGRLVALARRYLALREDQRFWFDRIAWEWKRSWLWLEEDTGLALRFLEAAEVRSVLDGDLPTPRAVELIERRRADWLAEGARRAAGDEPPTFLVGEQAALNADLNADPSARQLQGMGISPGVVTGPARVMRSLADAHRLHPGDILVARATDPAWTPLFLNASGLVMEIGGMLSHGAVVAREYRLPAVVNIVDATSRIHDGQTITLDGSRGRVWIR